MENENNIDKILFAAFQEKPMLEDEEAFTAQLMQRLPNKGVPTKTRIGILIFCTVLAMSIPLFNGGYEDFYVWGEEVIADSFFAFQYWIEELNWLA